MLEIVNGDIHFRMEEAAEGGYFASVPDLPGCFSEGRTLDEALKNIREALALYVEVSIEDGLPLPAKYRSIQAQAS